MLKYISKRIFGSIILLIVAFTVLYFCFWWINVEQFSNGIGFFDYLGIIWDRYVIFVSNIIRNNSWGLYHREEIWDVVFHRMHYTLKITLASLFFFTFGGIGLGLLAAMRRNKPADKIISGLSTIFSSIPSFVMVWLLMLFLGWELQILPPIYPAATTNVWEGFLGLIIPVFSLALWPLSKMIQLVRGEIIENITTDYIMLARIKGLTENQCIKRHLLKNISVVILPEITTSFMFVLTSSFLVEIIYNINGVANLFYDSFVLPYGDLPGINFVSINVPIALLIVTFYISFGILMSLLFDCIHIWVDPRIKIGSNKFNT
jgi:oligopeptide transport system permease protein